MESNCIEILKKNDPVLRKTIEKLGIINLETLKDISDSQIKKAIQKIYRIDEELNDEEFFQLKKTYEPYNSLAAFYICKAAKNNDFQIDLNHLDYTLNDCEESIGFMYTKVGWLKIINTKNKLIEINFVKYPNFYIMNLNKLGYKTIKQLEEYFDKKRKDFDIPLELDGTDFQVKTWRELIKIPYNTTISYQELAERVTDKKAARAVGMANNRNKIPIIIPCHRVIGKDKKLVGYSSGLKIKELLINHELK